MYNGTVQWTDMEGRPVSQFGLYIIYRAVVTLSVVEPLFYTFDGINADFFTYSNAASVTNAENSGIVTITFSRTLPLYLNLGASAIMGCCWTGNDTPSNLFLDNNNRWAHAWENSNLALNNSHWMAELYPAGIGFRLDGDEGGRGHPRALGQYGLASAHFFSIDLGEDRDIIAIEYRSHTQGNRFAAGVIYISDFPIGVAPMFDGASRLVASFDFDPENTGTVEHSSWCNIDIAGQNDGNPVRARYIQIRFTKLSPNSPGWISGQFNRLRVGVRP
jgi:hypothetical protein